ncbi:DUF6500 family protein [Klebsiella pneumoniae]
MVKVCEAKTAAKGDDVGVSFYAFFANKESMKNLGVLGIFRPKTTKCSGGRAVRGLQRGITFR